MLKSICPCWRDPISAAEGEQHSSHESGGSSRRGLERAFLRVLSLGPDETSFLTEYQFLQAKTTKSPRIDGCSAVVGVFFCFLFSFFLI